MEFPMRLTVLMALLLLSSSPALAQDHAGDAGQAAAQGPILGDLLKRPAYFEAWQALLGSETPPDWVTEYTATLDGPPVPHIRATLDGHAGTLGVTCKPNECEDNQLYVLFAPDGSKAWALMATASAGIIWLGYPDERIQTAINGALKK